MTATTAIATTVALLTVMWFTAELMLIFDSETIRTPPET